MAYYHPQSLQYQFIMIGVMSAILRHDGNKEDFIEPFILTYRKSLNMSELLLIILKALVLFKLL